jgi:hypothetical protein
MANEHAVAENGMTFGELLENRSSIRRYQDRPVSVHVVQEMIHSSWAIQKESLLLPRGKNRKY